MPIPTPSEKLDYAQVRLRWCRASLMKLLRRWATYIVVAVVVLGSSAAGSAANMSSMLVVPLLPLLFALEQPLWIRGLTVIAYSLLGLVVCWGLRPLLWPSSWRDVEWSLPISRRAQGLSDLTVVLIGLTPLFGLYAAGLVVWMARTPHWKAAALLAVLALLLPAMVLSLLSGMAILRALRGQGRASALALGATVARAHPAAREWKATSAFSALIVLPLMRGPARRAGRLLLFTPLLAAGHALALWAPALTPWWLAAFALLSLLLTTRLNSLLCSDLAPLHAACAPLPVAAERLVLARHALAMLPVVFALALLAPVLLWLGARLRPGAAVGFVLVVLGGNLFHVLRTAASTASLARKEDSSTRAAGWLVILALQIAFASEIMAK